MLQFPLPAAAGFEMISVFATIFLAISVCRNTLRPPPLLMSLKNKPLPDNFRNILFNMQMTMCSVQNDKNKWITYYAQHILETRCLLFWAIFVLIISSDVFYVLKF